MARRSLGKTPRGRNLPPAEFRPGIARDRPSCQGGAAGRRAGNFVFLAKERFV
jgi:hypothetical protein